MDNYRHLLVAVDFAPDKQAVLDRAVALAKANGAKLTLLHVVEYAALAYSGDLIMPEEVVVDQEMADQARKQLEELRQARGLSDADLVVEIGTPKQEIARVAAERDVDLIVLGSHGRHGLQLLLGSTANGVLHQAPCDVLAVRVSA